VVCVWVREREKEKAREKGRERDFVCCLTYGVATISRLFQIIGLFCKRAL